MEFGGESSCDDKRHPMQHPRVIRERCIRCGICEYKCPVSGEAVIRVYVA